MENIINTIKKTLNCEITAIEEIKERGLVNQLYVVQTSKGKFIFRMDPHEATLNRFRKEQWCGEAATANAILTAKILTTGITNNHPYMLMPFIEGTAGDKYKDIQLVWKRLGEYAKRIHAIPVSGFGEEMTAPGQFSDTWDRYLNYNIQSLTKDDQVVQLGIINADQSDHIKSVFKIIQNQKWTLGLNHNDIAPKNTIVNNAGKVYLLDCGSAVVAPIPHLDFTEILDSSIKEDSREFSIFLEGYNMSFQEYQQLKPQMAMLDLLVKMDKLRWALAKRPEVINRFVKELHTALMKTHLAGG